MEAALIGVAVTVVVQFGLLWYRIGRLDGKLEEHCRRINTKLDNGNHDIK